MKHLRIFHKIFLSHSAVGMLSVITLSFIFYYILSDVLIRRTIDQLSSINILKKNQIEIYFQRMEENLCFLFEEKKNGERYSPESLSEIKDLYRFENISIYDQNFRPVYSLSGFFTDESVLKERVMVSDGLPSKIIITDLTRIDSDSIVKIAYVYSEHVENSVARYILIEEDFQKIQDILHERTGMGSTGESYAVGRDLYMRSASRFFPDSIPMKIKVHTEAAVNALKDIEGNGELKDYRGVEVLSVYRPLKFSHLNWAIISEMDVKEAMKPINNLKTNVIILTALIIFFIVLITLIISNAISKPVLYLKEKIIELSKGIIREPEWKIDSDSRDEIGEMAFATRQLIQGLKRTETFANEIGSGNFLAEYATLSDQDALGLALISMRDKLKSLTEREIKLVKERASALLEGQEKERHRIIRELHDGVGQLLTVINLRLQAIEGHSEIIDEIKSLVRETIAEVRRISYNVMPSALVDFGLEAALRGLLDKIKKYSNLTYELNYVKETDIELNFEVRIAVYRIVQEALNNIVKHAGASHVEVMVVKTKEEIFILIKDDGKGFNFELAETKGGFGLRSMKERANLLNGEIEIQSSEGKGTIIEVHIPIN